VVGDDDERPVAGDPLQPHDLDAPEEDVEHETGERRQKAARRWRGGRGHRKGILSPEGMASLLLSVFLRAILPRHGGKNIMEIDSLQKLYVEELKDLHSAERQIIQALPKMIKAATSPDLKAAFQEHLDVTKEHLARLDQIFDRMGKKGTGKKCKGMEGVIADGKELLEEDTSPEVLDAGLISAAQHVEHYEMAGYGTVRTYANLLGEREAEKLLQKTLDEEGDADKKLTKLAERINVEAEAMVSR
jgi:ferritin-like metal-binding protein YciE